MARTTPKFNPFDNPLYDPIKDEEEGPRTYIGEGDPGQGFNFSDFMTAADAKELFQGMDTGQIEANVLQKMGVPDFLTNTQVQDAINQALGATDFLSQEDVERMLQDQMNNQNIDLSDYATSSDLSGFLSQEQIQQMIANAQMQGMTEQQILDMIKQVTGGQMSDDAIRELIAEAMGGLPGMDEIQRMIDEGLANGLSPEQINQMISEYLASNPIEGITAEGVQQMIADAIAALGGGESGEEGMSMEDIQALLDSGYMTADQINALMSDAGYLGQEGVDSSVQAALNAALGEGGAINSAIAAAMQSQGGGGGGETTPDPTRDFTVPTSYNPYTEYSNPYGSVSPYDIMGSNQFAGTTPFSGGTETGAGMSTGLAGLNLGDASGYNYNIPTTSTAELYPTGISSVYSNPPVFHSEQDPRTGEILNNQPKVFPDFFNTYGG